LFLGECHEASQVKKKTKVDSAVVGQAIDDVVNNSTKVRMVERNFGGSETTPSRHLLKRTRNLSLF
jgi:hypothetical protein